MAPDASDSARRVLEDDDQATPLLPTTPGSENSKQLLEHENGNEDFRTWLAGELSQQFWIAGPMIVLNFLQWSLNLVPLMFVGHLGTLELSGSQIAMNIAGATGLYPMVGLANGLETLCGQAYGARKYRLSGLFLQRAVFAMLLYGIPVSCVWWNLAPILKFIGQDPAISEAAQEYCRFLIPTLFAYAFLQPLTRFLQTQSAVSPMVWMTGITLVIHVPLCYLIIYYLGVGYVGAAIVNGIALWINVSLLLLYVNFSPTCKKTWTGLSSEVFEDLHLLFKIAVPSAFMTCLQFWFLNITILLSGLLPNPKLETASLSVSQNILIIILLVPFGFSAAVSTRASNLLGAGRPYGAKAAVNLTVSLALIEGCTLFILIIFLRNVFPYLFTSDPAVVKYVASTAPLLAAASLLDGYQSVLSGVARGCGWQRLGAYSNLIGFYGIGIPMSWLMTFHFNLRGYGLWIGIISGLCTQTFLLSWITFTLKWQKLAEEAAERVNKAKDHLHHDSVLP